MSMLQVDADQMLVHLVEAKLPAGSPHGLYIRFDVRGRNPDLVEWEGKLARVSGRME